MQTEQLNLSRHLVTIVGCMWCSSVCCCVPCRLCQMWGRDGFDKFVSILVLLLLLLLLSADGLLGMARLKERGGGR